MLLALNNCDFKVETDQWDEVSFRHVQGFLFVTLCDGDRINYIVFDSNEKLLGVESYEWPDWIPNEDQILAGYKQ